MNRLMGILYGMQRLREEAGGADEGDQGALGGGETPAETQGAGDQGALGGGETPAEQTAVDYGKMTDEEYFKDFKAPEGVEVDVAELTKDYGKFLRENGISREVFAKYLTLENGIQKAKADAAAAEDQKAEKAEREAFAKEGEAVRKEFTPEQIGSANAALRQLSGDKMFHQFATGRMSNNSTLVRLLVNWAETHGGDGLPGAGKGAAKEVDFATRWRG